MNNENYGILHASEGTFNTPIEPGEIAALRQLPLSAKTQKLAEEVRALKVQRDAVNPAIAKIQARSHKMSVDEAVAALTPLRIRQDIVDARLRSARDELFGLIVEDARAWVPAASKAADDATNASRAARANFEGRVAAGFAPRDAKRLLDGGAAARSPECITPNIARDAAQKRSLMACEVQRMLDRAHFVKLVAAGLCASCGRPYVMSPEWYRRNASYIVAELAD